MVKRILLNSVNYITVSLGLLLAAHSADAINWRSAEEIFRPQGDDAADTFIPVRFSQETVDKNPVAIVKMPGLEAGAAIVTAPAYQSLQDPIRQWLQRLGAGGAGGRSTRKISVAFVIHHRPSDFSVTLLWRPDGFTGKSFTAAIKFLPLTAGQISFSFAADQRAGMRVQSLPDGFLLRQLPYNSRDDAWWRVTIAGNNPREAFTFATIIMLPNGDIIITVEAIPSARFVVDNTGEIEELLRGISHPDHSCLAPYGLNQFDLDEATVRSFRRAIWDNNTKAIREILSNADDTQREELLRRDFGDNWTPLHLAANWGQTDVVTALLEHDPDTQIKAKDKDNRTALHLAAYCGQTDAVTALLEHDPDTQIKAKDKDNQTPLHLAAYCGRTDAVTALLEHDPDTQIKAKDKDNRTALHLAAYCGQTDTVTALLEHDPDTQINAKDKDDQTALHLAANCGQTDAVTALLKYMTPDQINAQDKDNRTALHLAAYCGQTDAVTALLKYDSNTQINAKDKDDQTPLHLAAYWGRTDTVTALLKYMTPDQINAQDKNGWTPLRFAETQCHEEIVASIRAALEERHE